MKKYLVFACFVNFCICMPSIDLWALATWKPPFLVSDKQWQDFEQRCQTVREKIACIRGVRQGNTFVQRPLNASEKKFLHNFVNKKWPAEDTFAKTLESYLRFSGLRALYADGLNHRSQIYAAQSESVDLQTLDNYDKGSLVWLDRTLAYLSIMFVDQLNLEPTWDPSDLNQTLEVEERLIDYFKDEILTFLLKNQTLIVAYARQDDKFSQYLIMILEDLAYDLLNMDHVSRALDLYEFAMQIDPRGVNIVKLLSKFVQRLVLPSLYSPQIWDRVLNLIDSRQIPTGDVKLRQANTYLGVFAEQVSNNIKWRTLENQVFLIRLLQSRYGSNPRRETEGSHLKIALDYWVSDQNNLAPNVASILLEFMPEHYAQFKESFQKIIQRTLDTKDEEFVLALHRAIYKMIEDQPDTVFELREFFERSLVSHKAKVMQPYQSIDDWFLFNGPGQDVSTEQMLKALNSARGHLKSLYLLDPTRDFVQEFPHYDAIIKTLYEKPQQGTALAIWNYTSFLMNQRSWSTKEFSPCYQKSLGLQKYYANRSLLFILNTVHGFWNISEEQVLVEESKGNLQVFQGLRQYYWNQLHWRDEPLPASIQPSQIQTMLKAWVPGFLNVLQESPGVLEPQIRAWVVTVLEDLSATLKQHGLVHEALDLYAKAWSLRGGSSPSVPKDLAIKKFLQIFLESFEEISDYDDNLWQKMNQLLEQMSEHMRLDRVLMEFDPINTRFMLGATYAPKNHQKHFLSLNQNFAWARLLSFAGTGHFMNDQQKAEHQAMLQEFMDGFPSTAFEELDFSRHLLFVKQLLWLTQHQVKEMIPYLITYTQKLPKDFQESKEVSEIINQLLDFYTGSKPESAELKDLMNQFLEALPQTLEQRITSLRRKSSSKATKDWKALKQQYAKGDRDQYDYIVQHHTFHLEADDQAQKALTVLSDWIRQREQAADDDQKYNGIFGVMLARRLQMQLVLERDFQKIWPQTVEVLARMFSLEPEQSSKITFVDIIERLINKLNLAASNNPDVYDRLKSEQVPELLKFMQIYCLVDMQGQAGALSITAGQAQAFLRLTGALEPVDLATLEPAVIGFLKERAYAEPIDWLYIFELNSNSLNKDMYVASYFFKNQHWSMLSEESSLIEFFAWKFKDLTLPIDQRQWFARYLLNIVRMRKKLGQPYALVWSLWKSYHHGFADWVYPEVYERDFARELHQEQDWLEPSARRLKNLEQLEALAEQDSLWLGRLEKGFQHMQAMHQYGSGFALLERLDHFLDLSPAFDNYWQQGGNGPLSESMQKVSLLLAKTYVLRAMHKRQLGEPFKVDLDQAHKFFKKLEQKAEDIYALLGELWLYEQDPYSKQSSRVLKQWRLQERKPWTKLSSEDWSLLWQVGIRDAQFVPDIKFLMQRVENPLELIRTLLKNYPRRQEMILDSVIESFKQGSRNPVEPKMRALWEALPNFELVQGKPMLLMRVYELQVRDLYRRSQPIENVLEQMKKLSKQHQGFQNFLIVLLEVQFKYLAKENEVQALQLLNRALDVPLRRIDHYGGAALHYELLALRLLIELKSDPESAQVNAWKATTLALSDQWNFREYLRRIRVVIEHLQKRNVALSKMKDVALQNFMAGLEGMASLIEQQIAHYGPSGSEYAVDLYRIAQSLQEYRVPLDWKFRFWADALGVDEGLSNVQELAMYYQKDIQLELQQLSQASRQSNVLAVHSFQNILGYLTEKLELPQFDKLNMPSIIAMTSGFQSTIYMQSLTSAVQAISRKLDEAYWQKPKHHYQQVLDELQSLDLQRKKFEDARSEDVDDDVVLDRRPLYEHVRVALQNYQQFSERPEALDNLPADQKLRFWLEWAHLYHLRGPGYDDLETSQQTLKILKQALVLDDRRGKEVSDNLRGDLYALVLKSFFPYEFRAKGFWIIIELALDAYDAWRKSAPPEPETQKGRFEEWLLDYAEYYKELKNSDSLAKNAFVDSKIEWKTYKVEARKQPLLDLLQSDTLKMLKQSA